MAIPLALRWWWPRSTAETDGLRPSVGLAPRRGGTGAGLGCRLQVAGHPFGARGALVRPGRHERRRNRRSGLLRLLGLRRGRGGVDLTAERIRGQPGSPRGRLLRSFGPERQDEL